MVIEITKSIDSVRKDVIEWRRHFHRNPELSFQEEKTAQFVYDTLQSFETLARPKRAIPRPKYISDLLIKFYIPLPDIIVY